VTPLSKLYNVLEKQIHNVTEVEQLVKYDLKSTTKIAYCFNSDENQSAVSDKKQDFPGLQGYKESPW
jgi:hypothetical protein